MTCAVCRPTRWRGAGQARKVIAANARASVRWTRCPGCGHDRMPWEYPEPEVVPSGMRWEAGYVAPWVLMRRGSAVGCLVPVPWEGDEAWEAHRYYRQRSRGVGYRVVRVGSLDDCAHALVADCKRQNESPR